MRKTQTLLVILASVVNASSAWAMAAPPAAPGAPQPPAWVQFAPILVMIGIFYFIVLRPQAKQRRERDAMLNNLKKGDRIVTVGGLFATVVSVTPDVIEVKLNEETKVKLRRSGVADVLTAEPPAVTPDVVETSK